jgi:transcription elongation factor GreA
MNERTEVMTRSQRAALEAELAELEGPRRTEIVAAIKRAREFGDLSENFEYHSAKNEQGLLERRITILRSRLDNSTLVEDDDVSHQTVGVGSIVEIEDEGGERMEIEISSVGGAGAVSPDSPLGRALVGAEQGDQVQIAAPKGSWTARVVSIRRG